MVAEPDLSGENVVTTSGSKITLLRHSDNVFGVKTEKKERETFHALRHDY